MKEMMKEVLDFLSYQNLVTMIQAYNPSLYIPYGFDIIYHRKSYFITKDNYQITETRGISDTVNTEDMLKEYLINKGEKPFRASQLIEWIYRHKITSFDEMTNVKKTFIEELKNDFILDDLELVVNQKSRDGTQKFLFRLSDGNLKETVLMCHDYGYSVCVTTEVGCNMGCEFCASKIKMKGKSAGRCN